MAAPDFPVDATVALLDDEHRASPTGAKQKSTLLTVCPFILGNEFCERLAFYGYGDLPPQQLPITCSLLADNDTCAGCRIMQDCYVAFSICRFVGCPNT